MPLARIPLAVLLLVCVASSARGATTTSAEDCYFDVTEDQVSVSAANFVAVEGCYTESPEYESFDRTIYTNDGGAVTNGTTIAILGSEVSALLCSVAHIAHPKSAVLLTKRNYST